MFENILFCFGIYKNLLRDIFIWDSS